MTKRKLLLIVDDWELLERYEERLSSGFAVLCAPLGSEGIRMAREDRPDAIVLNLTFENMTVAEACALLRADPLTSRIPILAVGDGGDGPDRWTDETISLELVTEWLGGLGD